jgi:lysophospholipase L1-like esterase
MARFQWRRNTAAGAASNNSVLAAGEPGITTDTHVLKVGDGATAWVDLPEVGSPTYVRQSLGSRVILVGESHALGNSDNTVQARGDRDTLAYACASYPGLLYAGNYGVSSTSTATMLSTLGAAITATSPDWVVLYDGTYDMNPANAVPFATYQANIKTFVATVRAASARPVIATVMPTATTGAYQQNVELANDWLRYWSHRNGVDLLDTYSLVTDPATGGIKSAYSLDSVHCNAAGNLVVGTALGALISPRSKAWAPPLAVHQATDSKNLIGNALFLTDSNSDGLCDGFSKQAAATASVITGDTAIIGNWQRIADSDGTTISLAKNGITGWSVGDRIAFGCRVTNVVGSGGTKTFTVQLNFVNGSQATIKLASNWSIDITNAVLYGEATVPVGTTAINFSTIRNSGTAGSGGYTQTAQLTVRNLTVEGALN